ncbi:MAG TPA: DNA polymerase III subunit gamma/tau [Acidobacteriota bacterium]|nr:DNA polymerase III subunit gamma/tau [Acidobacteriota bacterium]
MYQVLARKWRPQVFEDLVGQQTVTQTLENAITSGKIAHAFLFSGPRGVGKTTCARILAKALNCQSTPGPTTRPCDKCPSCVDIASSRSMDVLEIDGASNRGIDEVRELRDSAKYQAIRDRFRIFVIDEVHMLTTEAFNALLKILEEPPPHVFFIFATTELRKVPETIISRCQVHDFKKIPDRILVQRLRHIVSRENIEISDKSLESIAAASEGGLRDALGTLDQVVAFSGMKVEEKDVQVVLGLVDTDVMIELGRAIAEGDTSGVLSIFEKISEYGLDYKIFYNELLSFYRDLFLARFSSGTVEQRLRDLAGMYEEVHLLRICHQLVSIQSLLRLSGNLRFLFEVTLVRLSQMKRMIPLEELAESLKKNSGSFPPLPLSAANPPPVRPAASAPQQPAARPAQAPVAMAEDFFAVFISDLEVINSRLAAALEHASFVRTESKVSFYVPETVYAMIKLDQKTQSDFEGLLQRRLGEPISVEIHRGNPPSEKEAAKVSTPETLVENDPLVKEFVKTFKGRISKIELNKERYS